MFNKLRLSHNYEWMLRARKHEISDRFCIYKYVGHHTCGVENITGRYKNISGTLVASLLMNEYINSKGQPLMKYRGPSSESSKEKQDTIGAGLKIYWPRTWLGLLQSKDILACQNFLT